MSQNLPDVDDLFRKALDGYDDSPSPAVWDGIDKNLDKKKVHFISEKYRKLKWVAAALFLFSAGMAMYTLNTRMKNKELVTQNEINRRNAFKRTSPLQEPSIPNAANSARASNNKGEDALAGKATEKVDRTARSIDNSTVAKSALLNQTTGAAKGLPNMKTTDGNSIAANSNKVYTLVKKGSVQGEEGVVKILSDSKQTDIAIQQKKRTNVLENQKLLKIDPKADVTTGLDMRQEIATADRPKVPLADNAPDTIRQGTSMAVNAIGQKQTIDNAMSKQKKTANKMGNKPLFSATAFFSPDFVSARVDNDRRSFREDDRNEIKNKEDIRSSYSTGVLLGYNVAKNWSILSGVTFSSVTTTIRPKTIFARPDNRGNINYRFNCTAGYSYVSLKTGNQPVNGDSVTALSSMNALQYIGVPIGIIYNLSKGKFGLNPGIGITANFLTKSNLETVIAGQGGNESKSINTIEGLNSNYFNGTLSLAASYSLTQNLALNFTPVARFALSAINKDAPVKTYLNSFGLAAGVTFKF